MESHGERLFGLPAKRQAVVNLANMVFAHWSEALAHSPRFFYQKISTRFKPYGHFVGQKSGQLELLNRVYGCNFTKAPIVGHFGAKHTTVPQLTGCHGAPSQQSFATSKPRARQRRALLAPRTLMQG
jgi:hypothetical protein